jgi:hypothetical protein
VSKREPKDYIGPTINKRKVHCVPDGPIADLSTAKTTKGINLAKKLLGVEEPKVEGTIIKGPPGKTPVRKRKIHCVPEGPIADITQAKSTEGVNLAKKLLTGDDKKVEGTMLKAPLQKTPVLQPGEPIPKPAPKRGPDLSVDPQAVVGMTHIDSYQTLMRNDRMEKPMVKGWSDEDS